MSSGPSEKSKRNLKGQGVSSLVLSFVDRSTTRIAILLIPSLIIALLFAQTLNPMFVPLFANPLAKHIANELDPKTISNFEILQVIRRYNLAWCYLTDTKNQKIVDVSSAFAPRTRRIPAESKAISIRDENFYEAVVPYGEEMNLHVGLPFGHRLPNLTSIEALSSTLYAPVYFGAVLFILFAAWVAILIILESVIGLSSRALGASIDTLAALINDPFTDKQVKDATKLTWCPADFRALGSSLDILMNRVRDLKDKEKERTTEQGLDTLKWKGQMRPAFQTTEAREKATASDYNAVESGVFAIKFDKELRSVESSYEFAVMLLDGIHELFADVVDAAAFLKVEKNQIVTVESCLGIDDDSLLLLNKIDHREIIDDRNMSQKSIDVGPLLIKKFGFEALANKDNFGRVVYFPFTFEGKPLALLTGFMRVGHNPPTERIRALERFRDKAVEVYYEHRAREEKNEDRWTDPATGMGNKTYFQELMPKLVERTRSKGNDGNFSIMMIQPNFQTPRLAKFPAEMHDRWFAEIGKMITGLLPVSKKITPEKGATNYLIRYQEHVMAVVLEGINASAAVNVAEGIRNSVLSKSQWSGGTNDLSVSIGVATYPRDSDSGDTIIANAVRTLSYVRENLGGNAVCDFQKVPAEFQPREATEIQGTLGVLDNVGLLQSIANSDKSGVLIVVNDIGQKLVSTWVDGAPCNASLGDLSGLDALVEFITTFKNGSYNFQARNVQETGKLGSLERCLMEAALCEDKMNSALRMIPSADRLVRGVDNPAGWQRVSQDPDIDPDEITVMKELYALADGSKTLSAIFGKMPLHCTAMRWRAAALLLQYELMQMKIPT